ncbi:hypothetical protein [Pseudodesulfovibrio senegalensis]|uniref:Uncharacterized protein n=1 Tax=Pseudodesulfovibrio senegalensis TaxID=1721087 RepID=A0A6N6MZ59_9BACT|nr:hypothetical protein [Pseudodesulfovibrio senegalensis]KAB1437317.1 hypothetical protein F8A88_15435 [Pseudodesulfovibrio senegalensis]
MTTIQVKTIQTARRGKFRVWIINDGAARVSEKSGDYVKPWVAFVPTAHGGAQRFYKTRRAAVKAAIKAVEGMAKVFERTATT